MQFTSEKVTDDIYDQERINVNNWLCCELVRPIPLAVLTERVKRELLCKSLVKNNKLLKNNERIAF